MIRKKVDLCINLQPPIITFDFGLTGRPTPDGSCRLYSGHYNGAVCKLPRT